MKRLGFAILLLLAVFQFALAQTVRSWLEPDTIHFAQSANWTVEVSAAQGAQVVFPNPNRLHFPNSVVVASHVIDTVDSERQVVYRYRLKLIAFDVGQVALPSVQIAIDGQIFNTDSLRLTVLPLEIDSAALARRDTSGLVKIFDVTQPLNAPFSWREFWLRYRYVLLALLLIALLAYVLWKAWKRYKQRQMLEAEKEEQLLPHQIALRELDWLDKQKLCARGQVEQFYTLLSEILRTYLEFRYEINALESTTSELKTLLQHGLLFDKTLSAKLIDVLYRADLVKFAKYQPLPTYCQQDLAFAKDFVEQTKPQPEAEQNLSDEQKIEKSSKV